MKRAEWASGSLSLTTRWLPASLPLRTSMLSCDCDGARALRCLRVPFTLHTKAHLRRQRRCVLLGFSRSLGDHTLRTAPRFRASTPAASSGHTVSAVAGRSAAEVAFEAAMLGDLFRPTEADHVDRESNKNASTDDQVKVRAMPTAGAQPSAPVANEAAHRHKELTVASTMTGSDTLSTQADALNGAAAEIHASSPSPSTPLSQQRHSTSVSSEEAFERALYSVYFEAPSAHERHQSTASEAVTAVAEEKAVKTLTPPQKVAMVAKEAAGGGTPAQKRLPASASTGNTTLSEAAFERALYGIDEPADMSLSNDTVHTASSVNEEVQRDGDRDSERSPNAAVAGVGNVGAVPNSVPRERPAGVETTNSGGGGDGAAPALPVGVVQSAHDHEELHAEFDVDEEGENPHLFETDESGPSLHVPLNETPPEGSVAKRGDEKTVMSPKTEVKRALSRDDLEVQPLLPPPPPTVSMTCPFAFEHRDAVCDAHALRNALFGVCDYHTGVVTHLDPADRVDLCMPLLDRDSKRNLFYESGWLLHLQAQENAWISECAVSSRKKLTRVEATESIEKLPSSEAAKQPGELESSLHSKETQTAFSPVPITHRDVVGRSKVLRCLVYRLLRAPHLWWDQVHELVSVAGMQARSVKEGDAFSLNGVEGTTVKEELNVDTALHIPCSAADRHDVPLCYTLTEEDVQTAMTRIFGTHPLDVHFFSSAVRRELSDLYRCSLRMSSRPSETSEGSASSPATSSTQPFKGPAAAWKAFVLTHRLQRTRVCGPHVRPFSYGEFRPTITAAELAPLQYCSEMASWPPSQENMAGSADATATARDSFTDGSLSPPAETHHGGEKGGGDLGAAQPWASMNEAEQNALLFGEEGAQLSAQIRSSDGIFVVYGQDGVSFEEEEKFTAAEAALQRLAEEEEEEQRQQRQRREGLSPLARARAEEMARVRLYDVDRVVLELANVDGQPDGSVASASFLSSVAFPPTASSDAPSSGRGRGGRSRRPAKSSTPFQLHLQNKEDVQLAALWQRFVEAPTGDLIDNLVHVQRHAGELVREAAVELIVQRAFWLLFYSRDEVRALTDPRRTYTTVWNLHAQLVELLTAGPRSSKANGSHISSTKEKVLTKRPDFESLALSSQVSYACFGFAHVPPLRVNAERDLCNSPSFPLSLPPLATPLNLYAALANTRATAVENGCGEADAEASEEGGKGGAVLSASDTFRTLSPEQQLAVGFCFPLSASERAEMSLRCVDGTSCIPANDQQNIPNTSEASEVISVQPSTSLMLRSQSTRRSARIAAWVEDAQEHIAATLSAQAAETVAWQRLLDFPHRRRGRPPTRLENAEEKHNGEEEVAVGESLGVEGEQETSLAAEEESRTMRTERRMLSQGLHTAMVQRDEEARRASDLRSAHEALEASVYRCFCSLRAAGVLPTPASASSQDNTLRQLLTSTQQAAIQRAVEAIVESLMDVSEGSKAGKTSATPISANGRKAHEDELCAPEQSAVLPCKTTTSHLRQERKPRMVKNDTAKDKNEDRALSLPVDKLAATAKRQRLNRKRHILEDEASKEVQPPKRGRGRPRRTLNADGTYTKAAYIHSAAYLERKQKKDEGQT